MKRKAGVVVRRWKHRELAMAYQRWGEETRGRMKMRVLTGKVVGRWRRSGMWKALTAWQANVAHRKQLMQAA
mgnify:FL=1